MQEYLQDTDIIDWQSTEIRELAARLAGDVADTTEIARRCFEWVRDHIEHCSDFDRDEVTCRASDVLQVGTGFCYAKSHLLAALLRARGIPAGFCYQRLSIRGDGPPFCLHGLNAVHLPEHGWYRIDARGNKPNVQAEFTPPTERLAFEISTAGEANLPEVYHEPLAVIVNSLNNATSARRLAKSLPDL